MLLFSVQWRSHWSRMLSKIEIHRTIRGYIISDWSIKAVRSAGSMQEIRIQNAGSCQNLEQTRGWNIDDNFKCLFWSSVWYKTEIASRVGERRCSIKVMPDEASVRQDSLRQDSLRQRVAYRAPGFERSCAQNGRKTHWGTSACALASLRQERTSAGQEFIENYMIFGI